MGTKNPVTIAAVIVGIVVVGWFVYSLQQSEEDRIRQRLHDLAEHVSTTKPAGDSTRLMHMAGLRQFFTEGVTIQIKEDIPKVAGRDNLLQMAHVALQHEPGLTVAFTDVSVTHNDQTQQARVNTTIVVTGVHSDKAKSVDAQELEIALVKDDGEWLIEAVRFVKAMELQ